MSNNDIHPAFQAIWDTALVERGWLHVGYDGTMTLNGREHGPLSLLTMRDWPVLGGSIVTVHEKGMTYWSGRGMRSYAPAEVHTYLVHPTTDPRGFRYVRLASSPAATNDTSRQEAHSSVTKALLRIPL
jgi:hypothetical protein